MTIINEAENKILDFIKNIENKCSGFFAAIFHLSKLQEQNRSEFQIKIAVNIINDYLKNSQKSQIFTFKNNDIIVYLEDSNGQLIEKITHQLRFLFAEDNLSYIKGKENNDFSSVFMLKFQFKEFYDACYNKLYPPLPKPEALITKTITENNNYSLNKIDDDLTKIELSPFVRIQEIVAINEDDLTKIIFNKIFLSLPHIKHHLQYEQKFAEVKLLDLYLNEKLDLYLIKYFLENLNEFHKNSLNISLSIKTIISEEFIEINRFLKSHKSFPIIIDLNLSDVFFDLKLFFYVREYLKSLNYILCLNNVDHFGFINLNRHNLGFDLIKLKWDPDMVEEISLDKMQKAILQHGTSRVILADCDDEKAIYYSKQVGIGLISGPITEKVSHELVG